MNGIHISLAIPLLVVGWVGLHMRKSVIGGAVSILIAWQGILAIAAISVFQRSNPAEGAVLLWILVFGSFISLASLLAIGLRRYYVDKDVSWRSNEEIRH